MSTALDFSRNHLMNTTPISCTHKLTYSEQEQSIILSVTSDSKLLIEMFAFIDLDMKCSNSTHGHMTRKAI